jgi:hypothetical protein
MSGCALIPILITLPAGENAIVDLPTAPPLTLSGKFSVDGKAVAGVEVRKFDMGTHSTTRSDSYGKYSLRIWKDSIPWLSFSHKYFDFAPYKFTAPGLTENTTLNLTTATLTVSGRVVNAAGSGLGGVKVCVKNTTQCALTTPQGYYQFTVADEGVNLWLFSLTAQADGKIFTPSLRPVSPTYGKTNKNFIALP